MCLAQNSFDANSHSGHGSDHQKIFHALTVEADAGEALDGSARSWDLDGWVGSDYNKLWLKSEGKKFGKYDKNLKFRRFTAKILSNFGMHKLVCVTILKPTSLHILSII